MKSLLAIFSSAVLGVSGAGSAIVNTNITNTFDIPINRPSVRSVQSFVVKSPLQGSLVTTAGDAWTSRMEWSFVVINLGKKKQEQIKGISSTYNDSYTEHKVSSYSYHKVVKDAGVNLGKSYDPYQSQNFRDYFKQGLIFKNSYDNSNFEKVARNMKTNFYSFTTWGWAQHSATGGIGYFWDYDTEGNLLVQIVGMLNIWAAWSGVEGVASIKLGSYFTVWYQ